MTSNSPISFSPKLCNLFLYFQLVTSTMMSLHFFLSPFHFSFFSSSFPHHSSFIFLLQGAGCQTCCTLVNVVSYLEGSTPLYSSQFFGPQSSFRIGLSDIVWEMSPLQKKSHLEEQKDKSMLSLLAKNLSGKCLQSSSVSFSGHVWSYHSLFETKHIFSCHHCKCMGTCS